MVAGPQCRRLQDEPRGPLVGLLVEGESDYAAVRVILNKAGVSRFFRLKFGPQPVECSVQLLVEGRLLRFIRLAMLKKADKVIVLLDREWRDRCAPALAVEVAREIERQMQGSAGLDLPLRVCVVCPDRSLENWLIADPEKVSKHALIAKRLVKRVGAKADDKDAVRLIKWAFRKGRSYLKARDAPALARLVRVLDPAVRRRSKSLDKFLREAGVPHLQ